MLKKNIKVIENFWNDHTCGIRKYTHNNLSDYYKDLSNIRYKEHHELHSLVEFKKFKNKKVLEIGLGVGNDASEFVKYKAIYNGIDLSKNAVDFCKKRLDFLYKSGDILQGNAENLPYKDESFDFVYSFGVIHHTEYPNLIVDEIHRVLKKNGSFFVMVYNRSSIFYKLEILVCRRLLLLMCFLKFNILLTFLLKGKLKIKAINYFHKLKQRYKSNPFISNQELLNHSTDGVDCPLSRVYNKKESLELFLKFKNLKTHCFFMEKKHSIIWILFGFILNKYESFLSKKFGWFRIIEGKK